MLDINEGGSGRGGIIPAEKSYGRIDPPHEGSWRDSSLLTVIFPIIPNNPNNRDGNGSGCGGMIPAELAFKLYNTHGLQEEALELVATLKQRSVDWPGFKRLMAQMRMETLHQSS